MMKRRLGWLLLAILVATPAAAQQISIDYDEAFPFEKVKTFAYVETAETSSADDLTDSRIRDAIVRELKSDGLEQVDGDADLYVTYHLSSEQNMVVNTTSFGYGGHGNGWHRWGGGVGSSTMTATTYTEGTLIVDAFEPSEKTMVWRGMGTVTLKSKPEKQANQIDKIMTKMGQKWQKILAKEGK